MKNVYAAVVLGAGLLAGCAPATVNTVEIPAGGSYNWVNTDPKLGDVARVTRVNKAKADDLLRVQVDVLNTTNYPHRINYRFTWLDDAGQTIDTPLSAWRQQVIQGQQTFSLKGVAPDARVTDVRVEMLRDD